MSRERLASIVHSTLAAIAVCAFIYWATTGLNPEVVDYTRIPGEPIITQNPDGSLNVRVMAKPN